MRVFPEYSGPMKDWPQVETIPGAAGMLDALRKDWLLCLATNAADSDEAEIRAALRRVDLERRLDKVYCFKTIGYKKPSPEFFGKILKDLDLPAEKVIMVGDDYVADVLGAQNAGLRAVWFNQPSWIGFKLPIDDLE